MKPLSSKFRITVLVSANALILTFLGLRLWNGTQTERILHSPVHQLKVPALLLDAPPLEANFNGLTGRTPFYATRKVYVVPSKSGSSAPPPPAYVFGGAVVRPNSPAVALLNSANGGTLRVTAGQDINGWLVESVEVSRVVLRYENLHAEIARVAKQGTESAPGSGISRVPLTRGNHIARAGGVSVLGNGAAVAHASAMPATAVAKLPPLAGSGSGNVYIPPPPR